MPLCIRLSALYAHLYFIHGKSTYDIISYNHLDMF